MIYGNGQTTIEPPVVKGLEAIHQSLNSTLAPFKHIDHLKFNLVNVNTHLESANWIKGVINNNPLSQINKQLFANLNWLENSSLERLTNQPWKNILSKANLDQATYDFNQKSRSVFTVSLFETLRQKFPEALQNQTNIINSFTGPITINRINETLVSNSNIPNSPIGLISTVSLLKSLSIFDDEEDIKDTYRETESYISENPEILIESEAFKIDLITTPQSQKSKNEEWVKLNTFHEKVELFINKTLIKKHGVSRKIATIIGYSLLITVLMSMSFLPSLIINEVFTKSNTDKTTGETKENYYLSNKDFTIQITPVYLRPSQKTKRLGHYPINTDINILKIKKGWCLIEGIAIVTINNNRKNRKKYHTDKDPIILKKQVRGWVQKEYLDMFQ